MIPRKSVGLVLLVAVMATLNEITMMSPKLAVGDDKAAEPLPTPQQLLDALPSLLTAEIPGDVNRDLQQKLDADKQFAEVQLLFDILSWRSFVALNWPVGAEGKPQPLITDTGKKRWDTFKPSDDVFRTDGAKPSPWGDNHSNARYLKRGVKAGERVFSALSAVHGTINTVASVNDVLQAFKYPIWDQNGFMLRYSIVINEDEFDYIVLNELYNLEGQAAFWKKGKPVSFPISNPAMPQKVGAIEVKLAWKVLKEDKGDLPGRFITTEGIIFTGPSGETPVTVTLGLVGMHISHKTGSSPQWIWSTFMHVDSLQTNALETFENKAIKTLFANPQKEYLPVNIPDETLKPFVDGRAPTQVAALTPIPLATQAVNKVAQLALRKKNSVLQYYQLLNTQWPVKPSDPPTPPGTYPDSLTNKSGGRPTPVYLINPLMETYFQGGNQAFGNLEDTMPPADKKLVFGTESCVGCHYSAAIATDVTVDPQGKKSATFGPSQSADFSWLLQQRAHFKESPKK
jgi:hypothetical protein